MKSFCVLVALLLCRVPTPCSAQTINLNIKSVADSVVFLYAGDSKGPDQHKPVGTGFFVGIPLKGSPNLFRVLLLVTARHVFEPAWAYCPSPNPEILYARVNLKDYDSTSDQSGVGYVPVTLRRSGKPLYSVSADATIDAAFIALPLETFLQSKYSLQAIGISNFATDKELQTLEPGSDIATAGLIPGRSGQNRNYPFFKFGKISNIPGETISVDCGPDGSALRQEHVWFLDVNLQSGASGSPIFYVPFGGNGASFGGGRTMLIGIQSSAFSLNNNILDISGMTQINPLYENIKQHSPAELDLDRH